MSTQTKACFVGWNACFGQKMASFIKNGRTDENALAPRQISMMRPYVTVYVLKAKWRWSHFSSHLVVLSQESRKIDRLTSLFVVWICTGKISEMFRVFVERWLFSTQPRTRAKWLADIQKAFGTNVSKRTTERVWYSVSSGCMHVRFIKTLTSPRGFKWTNSHFFQIPPLDSLKRFEGKQNQTKGFVLKACWISAVVLYGIHLEMWTKASKVEVIHTGVFWEHGRKERTIIIIRGQKQENLWFFKSGLLWSISLSLALDSDRRPLFRVQLIPHESFQFSNVFCAMPNYCSQKRYLVIAPFQRKVYLLKRTDGL